MRPALTSLSHGAGCGCKLSAADLRPIVAGLPRPTDPRVLVAADTADDAGVVRLSDDLALVADRRLLHPDRRRPVRVRADRGDQRAVGRLRDGRRARVGAQPRRLPAGDARARRCSREILRGGADAVAAAGASIVGGHSIDDPEPKYGLAVTGTVHPDAVLTNAGGAAGDALVLTKPLGRRDGGHGAQARAGRRRPGGARDRGDDDAQRPGRRAGACGAGARAHGRHGLRAARARRTSWRRRAALPRRSRRTRCPRSRA